MPQIVGLPAATLPVDGTEIAVVVQGGITSQIAVSDLVTPLSGSVTSVAASVPASIMSVAGSPITTSGTLAVSLATQTANTVWAGPTTGGAATPTFRALVAADITAATDITRVHGVASSIFNIPAASSKAYYMRYESVPDKLYFTSNGASGMLSYMDRTSDMAVLLATYSSPAKTPGAFVYSAVNTLLYIQNANGGTVFSANSSTGAVVTAGIAVNAEAMAIRTSTGLIYCVNSGGAFKSLDPATDTVSASLGTAAVTAGSPFSITYCSTNDSMYILQSDGKVVRYNCATATLGTPFTCFSSASSAGAIAYHAPTNLIYVVAQNDASGIKTIAPASDAVANTYPFPSGFLAQTSANAAALISYGNYIYVGTSPTSPGMVLVFNPATAAFIAALAGPTGSALYGRAIGGVPAEGVLYACIGSTAAGNAQYVVFGR